jgi:hypothetical protein
MGENLELDEYKRYGRQMILDGIGRDGGPPQSPMAFYHSRSLSASRTAAPQTSLCRRCRCWGIGVLRSAIPSSGWNRSIL